MLAEVIKNARIKAGLSQRELAKRCQISESQIIRIEQSKSKKPRPYTLNLLANGLGLDIELLNKECGRTNI